MKRDMNRLVLDCPECGSKNIERLGNVNELEAKIALKSKYIVRCNDCREFFELQIQMYKDQFGTVEDKLKELKGAKA